MSEQLSDKLNREHPAQSVSDENKGTRFAPSVMGSERMVVVDSRSVFGGDPEGDPDEHSVEQEDEVQSEVGRITSERGGVVITYKSKRLEKRAEDQRILEERGHKFKVGDIEGVDKARAEHGILKSNLDSSEGGAQAADQVATSKDSSQDQEPASKEKDERSIQAARLDELRRTIKNPKRPEDEGWGVLRKDVSKEMQSIISSLPESLNLSSSSEAGVEQANDEPEQQAMHHLALRVHELRSEYRKLNKRRHMNKPYAGNLEDDMAEVAEKISAAESELTKATDNFRQGSENEDKEEVISKVHWVSRFGEHINGADSGSEAEQVADTEKVGRLRKLGQTVASVFKKLGEPVVKLESSDIIQDEEDKEQDNHVAFDELLDEEPDQPESDSSKTETPTRGTWLERASVRMNTFMFDLGNSRPWQAAELRDGESSEGYRARVERQGKYKTAAIVLGVAAVSLALREAREGGLLDDLPFGISLGEGGGEDVTTQFGTEATPGEPTPDVSESVLDDAEDAEEAPAPVEDLPGPTEEAPEATVEVPHDAGLSADGLSGPVAQEDIGPSATLGDYGGGTEQAIRTIEIGEGLSDTLKEMGVASEDRARLLESGNLSQKLVDMGVAYFDSGLEGSPKIGFANVGELPQEAIDLIIDTAEESGIDINASGLHSKYSS